MSPQSRKSRGARGFSLIELLIVVAIILIIAAIAVPSLMKSRMAANEASAAGTLRTYNTTSVSYSTLCPALGFPANLAVLGPGAGDCTAANLIDSVLSTAPVLKSQYQFVYTPGAADASGRINTYKVTAVTVVCGVTATRAFYTDETGVIRFTGAPGCPMADATSAPMQ